ncbi:hypothetical protein EON65_12160 [archaeon]|nr:MAG: hypothetical protein EON65_12160 [archaeon]
MVRQMAFSPQSDKLAIAQSDNMVFVYKLGAEWGDKKSICNKFQHSTSISALVWPTKRINDIVYGLAEGTVRIAHMKSNKPTTLYQTESYVTAMACNPMGNSVVVGHLDGSIYVFSFEMPERGAKLITRFPGVPFALAWGTSICVGGNTFQVAFYDEDGAEEQIFDMTDDKSVKEFTVACSNPTGDTIAMGNYNAIFTFNRNKDSMIWESRGATKVENMYSVTAMDWKPDGDKLAVGTLTGVVDLYDVCVKRTMYKGGFELTYVSHSQVIVRQVETNLRIVVRSQYGREITKTNIYKGRFVVANTADTILLGDLESLKLSEIQWHNSTGNEKYVFDNPSACVIYYAGEANIVEYGIDEVLGSVRTQYMTSHVISLRINERPHDTDNKKIAFLLDAQTISIKDLVTQASITVSHDSRIDWLELNSRASLLLFRDKRRYLHLFNLETQSRSQLLNFCTYVQWVPGSDVVVAQNRNTLCVWYNIHAPDQITQQPIKGEIEDIERVDGRTEVIVDEGMAQAVYPLDEALIDFGTAIDDMDYMRAMDILDPLIMTSDVESMWNQLLRSALNTGDVRIAQRCAAALGDVSLCKYMGEIREIAQRAEQELGIPGNEHYQVRSKMALLHKDLKAAEAELLNQGKIDECITMYQSLFRHEEAIRVAEQSKHKEAGEMRQAYFQYLLDSNQEDKAAALKVKECDFVQAINLYMKGGMPGKAAQVILDNDIQQPLQLLDSVATALSRAGLHDKAGEFYERLNELPRALDSYIRGNAYRKAVELARKCFPAKVVQLQEQWGDYLVSQKQIDMAINHYIEAKQYLKAIEAALNAKQYARALQLVDAVDIETARPYYKQLARYYEDSRVYEMAEKCYVAAGQPQLAVEMHTKLGNWEVAHKIAMSYMKEGEVALLYINQAQKLEGKSRLKEAEKLYIAVNEKDLAINMYKKHKRYDDMIRLVKAHRPDLLKETHQFLGQTLEMENSLKEAEHHYVEAGEWHSAVSMYRSNELWDDAIRVAKFYGGVNACKRVTIALLMAVGVIEGTKYLTKHGLVEAAIEHACESGAFDMALEVAGHTMPKKLPEIHLKHALFLEDDERFREAEEEFLKASKPKEAIDMYVHQQDWVSAVRVAEQYEPAAISDIYIAQAKLIAETGDYHKAEELYLAASRPELALEMYTEKELWQEASRLAQLHLPHRAAEVMQMYSTAQARQGKGNSRNDFMSMGRSLEQNKQYVQALDMYLGAKVGKVDNVQDLEDIWERAILIARSYVPNRHVEVALEIARRLSDINQEEAAADILCEINRQDEAIHLLLQAKKYDKAKQLSKGNALLKKKVEDAYQAHLVSREDTKELFDMGAGDVAIEVLAKRGDWERVWEMCSKEKMSVQGVSKYLLMRIDEVSRSHSNNIYLIYSYKYINTYVFEFSFVCSAISQEPL